MKYFMYCRKSSEEETKQVQSLDTQERLLTDYAQKFNLEIVDVIREMKSAKEDGNRPLFTEMLHRVLKGEADAILVVHTDRLARNLIEAGQIIKLVEHKQLTQVRTLTNTFDTSQSLFYMGFDFIFASQFSRDLSVKVRAGVESKLLKGEYPSWAPTGYINREAKIYPDPEREDFIRMIYNLYVTGTYSLNQITNILYEHGFRTRIGNNKVAKSVIFRILKDPIYCGMIRRKGRIYSGIHEPIVSKALFDQVQDVFDKVSRPIKLRHEFLYRNYMTCAKCGCKLTATLKKGFTYYYCTNGRKKCSEHKKYLKDNEIQDLLHKMFSEFTLDEKLADLSLRAYENDLRKNSALGINTEKTLRVQIFSIDIKLDRLLDTLLEKRIDESKYDLKRKDLLSEKAKIETQLKQINPVNPETTLEQVTEVKNKAISLGKVFFEGDSEVKADLLKSLLWNVTIGDQKIASQDYKLPFKYLVGLNKTDDIDIWR